MSKNETREALIERTELLIIKFFITVSIYSMVVVMFSEMYAEWLSWSLSEIDALLESYE